MIPHVPHSPALTAWSCRTPDLAPDDSAVAYVGDRDGSPRVWVQPLGPGEEARIVDTGPEPVLDVSWSPKGDRLAVLLAPGGGEHTQVWTVRPHGGDLRPVAAPTGSAALIRWTGRGDLLLIAETSAGGLTRAVIADVATGAREVVAEDRLLRPVALSRDHATLLLRHGPRGHRHMSVAGRPLLPGLPGTTDQGDLSPDGSVAYLVSDAARDRAALLAVRPGAEPVVLAERPDAELDLFAMAPDGHRALLVWNADGRSDLDVVNITTGDLRPLPPPPADVITSARVSWRSRLAALAAESPGEPSHVLLCDLDGGGYRHTAGSGPLAAADVELIRFPARDGLALTAWLHRPAGPGPAPFTVFLHGGPEDQERPTFSPLFQNLLAAGVGVIAPNVRGSGGQGRAFRRADDGPLRFRAIDDVADCVAALVRTGAADPSRIACMGWSYGGYLTLAALVTHPGLFRAGVDVCGMADFETFYARTQPWIAEAAVSEYGHPVTDRDLLRALSPLRAFDRLTVPLLVVHGVQDTNVPFHEAEQVMAAAAARGVPCDRLIFDDEGHEFRRLANRVSYVTTVTGWLSDRLNPSRGSSCP